MPHAVAGFIADVHVDNFAEFGGPMRGGLNDRARFTLRALTRATHAMYETVKKKKRGEVAQVTLFVAGDLFHTCSPSPPLVAAVMRSLPKTTIILPGNHDLASDEVCDHACAPLDQANGFWVVEREPYMTALPAVNGKPTHVISIPFEAGKPAEWLEAALQREMDMVRLSHPEDYTLVAVAHVGISDSKTPYYLDDKSGSINYKDAAKICKKYGISYLFSGDWHRHQIWEHDGVTVCQIGSLAPNRFPPNYEHGHEGPLVLLMDDGSVQVKDIPGPRFYKKRWSELVKTPDWRPDGCPAFLKVVAREDQVDEAKAWIKQVTDDNVANQVADALKEVARPDAPWVHTIRLEVDRGMSSAKAKTAAFAARSSSSVEQAISNYIAAMPLPAGVERDKVLGHVRRCMA